MSWHYLQGQEVASSEGKGLGGIPSVLLKLINTPEMSCSLDKQTGASQSFQCGMMLEPSMGNLGEGKSVLSQGVSRAKTLVAPGTGKVLKEKNQGYGKNMPVSLAKYDPVLCLWKTHQTLLFGGLEQFSEIFPRWGMMQDGECFRLLILVHATSEKGCGYLPTPSAVGQGGSGSGKKWNKINNEMKLKRMEAWPPLLEIMMGWPIGWTENDVSETGKIRER